MKMLRTVLGYAAMAVGVTVGGVIVGAIVVAPAVSRSQSLVARTWSASSTQQLEETGGAVGQADGDPTSAVSLSATSMATVAAVTPFKPLSEVIAADSKSEPAVASPRLAGFGRFQYEVADRFDDVLLAAGRVPKIFWVYADIGAVLLMAGVWFRRRRRADTTAMDNVLSAKLLEKRLVASLP